MKGSANRKTSRTLEAALLEQAKALGLEVSAVAGGAPGIAAADVRFARWLQESAAAFEVQTDWHERHGHSPGRHHRGARRRFMSRLTRYEVVE